MWAGTNITNSDAEAIYLITLIQDHSLFRCLPKGTTTPEEGDLSSLIDLVYPSPYIVSRIIESRVDHELDHYSRLPPDQYYHRPGNPRSPCERNMVMEQNRLQNILEIS
jgi:hypothetical protein